MMEINGNRLWESLMEIAEIGATEKGGCRRLALNDLDRQGRDLFVSWCREIGCGVEIDEMGNIFARKKGRIAMIFITHDLRVAAQVCDRVAVMRQGEVFETGSTSELFSSPKHDYTQALLAAVPGKTWQAGILAN